MNTENNVQQALQYNATSLRNKASTNSEDGKKLGKQDFLNLLMTQMANQDPLDPMDSAGMMQQLSSMGTVCLLYTSPSPRDLSTSRMPSSA